MIAIDGYSILYEKNRNKITILMPQTRETLNNTYSLPSNRKVDFTDAELSSILYMVKMIAEGDNLVREK